jgi:endoglucanase
MFRLKNAALLVTAGMIMLLAVRCVLAGDSNEAVVEKTSLCAFELNKRLGRGVNLGNALEAPNEGEWGVILKEEYFEAIKQGGFHSVRIPCRWSNHALKEEPYTIDPNFFNRVDWAVNCALSRNLPIIVNVHHYMELYTEPQVHRERFMTLWKQIAEHYKNYPDNLLLEIFNEPDDALTPEIWNEWLKEAHSIIRNANPTKTIVIDGSNDAWISYLQFLKLPEDDRNIIVSVHYYFPLAFTHQGAPWVTTAKIASFVKDMEFIHQSVPSWAAVSGSNAWMGTKWTGTEAGKKEITDAFDIAAAWGKEHNRPMNLGEFGAYNKADMESRARWTKFVADTAVERGMSFHYWQFASDFAVYDTKNKTWKKPLFDALLPQGCSEDKSASGG